MARYFFDSSALAKRYHLENGTAKVLLIFAEPAREVQISRLTFVEIQSVLAMKVRGGFLSPAEADLQRARLVIDITEGEITVQDVTTDHYSAAARLIGRHSFSSRLRTLDALQLAVVLDLAGQGLVDRFVVSDKTLGEVASHEGLVVLNPETA